MKRRPSWPASPVSVSIRTRLLVLLLSVMLPCLAGLVWLVMDTMRNEREGNQRLLRETTNALAIAVDGEFGRRDTIARVLAQSRWLDKGVRSRPEDVLRFAQLARRSLAGVEGWIQVWGPGAFLLDTRGPPSGDPPALLDASPRQPLSRLDGPLRHAMVVEPVVRDGQTVLNVGVALLPGELQRLIDTLSVPDGWVAMVMDADGRVVARQPGGLAHLGRPAASDLLEQLAFAPQGTFGSMSSDGAEVVGYYSQSARGWTYVSAMPRPRLADAVSPAVQHVLLGALVLTALAVLAARWVSRGIVAPMLALKAAARQLQSGEPIQLGRTGIVECDEVASALNDAHHAIRHNRAELERQVAEAIDRTRIAEQRLSQSRWIEALGRLTGGVAHEFNNLLGVISNCAHLIERHPAAAQLQGPLSATQRSVEIGSRLIQHLLRFAGRRPTRPQRVELGRWLPEIQEALRSVLGRRIEISVVVAADTEAIEVDPGELELALINLALNARDAMPRGGELDLSARNAEAGEAEDLPAGSTRRYVLISVSDTGEGVEPALLPRVFEPFFTTKAMGRGTGLGLSQVQSFCVQAGGTARLDSTLGIGTSVTLLLPAAGAAAGDVATPMPPMASSLRLDGKRVLLVEDNTELAGTTALLLEERGAQVRRATDASEALHQVMTQPFDVVLSDVMMPGMMDGLALARQMRAQLPALPVVLISGYSHNESAEFTVLRKPCSAQTLVSSLSIAMAQPAGRSSGPASATDPAAPRGGVPLPGT